MKKILIVCVFIVTMSATLSKAQTDEVCNDKWILSDSCLEILGIREKFELFKTYLDQAQRRSLERRPDGTVSDTILVVAAVPHRIEMTTGESWIMPINQQSGVNNYAVYVTAKLLLQADSLALEIASQQALCHVQLYNLVGSISDQNLADMYEFQVLQCVMYYVGGEKLEQYLTKDMLHLYSQSGNAKKAKELVSSLHVKFKIETLDVDTVVK